MATFLSSILRGINNLGKKMRHSRDIVYRRYFQDGKVTSVDKYNPQSDTGWALFPIDENTFSCKTRQWSDLGYSKTYPRRKIKKEKLDDPILLRLLNGESREKILRDYSNPSLEEASAYNDSGIQFRIEDSEIPKRSVA